MGTTSGTMLCHPSKGDVRILELKNLSVESLIKKLGESPVFINEFLDELTVNVTEMFRDPSFWRVMRE